MQNTAEVPRKKVDTDFSPLNSIYSQNFTRSFYVTLHGNLVNQYLQTYGTIFYLLDLEAPELIST